MSNIKMIACQSPRYFEYNKRHNWYIAMAFPAHIRILERRLPNLRKIVNIEIIAICGCPLMVRAIRKPVFNHANGSSRFLYASPSWMR